MKVFVVVLMVGLAIGFAKITKSGEIYKWTDKNGLIHYSDAPGPGAKDSGFSTSPGVSTLGPDESLKRKEAADSIKERFLARLQSCRITYNGLQLQQCIDHATTWYDKELNIVGYERIRY
jgi:hypothetical protein